MSPATWRDLTEVSLKQPGVPQVRSCGTVDHVTVEWRDSSMPDPRPGGSGVQHPGPLGQPPTGQPADIRRHGEPRHSICAATHQGPVG